MAAGSKDVPHVLIAGAGIAGMAAAQVLIEAGCRVTVLEKSSAVGGKCISYFDQQLGHTVEHGIHGIFPRYVNLRGLWAEAGIDPSVYTRTQTIGMPAPNGRLHELPLDGVRGPAPLFLLRMAPKGVLRARDVLSAIPLLLRTYAASRQQERSLDETTFGGLLRASGVSGRLARLLLLPYVKNLAYARGDEVSAAVAVEALNYYITEHAEDHKAEWVDGGLSERIFEPWRRALEQRGVRFELSTPVQRVLMQDDGFVGLSTRSVVGAQGLSAEPRLWTESIDGRRVALNWNPATGQLLAFDARCTHRGCPVTAQQDADRTIFHCACHGGQFSGTGEVLRGPPTEPLVRLRVRHDASADGWVFEDEDAAPGDRTPASGSAGVYAGNFGILATDLPAVQRMLPPGLLRSPALSGLPLLRTTSVMVLRMRFVREPGRPRWSGPDSGVFAADDLLDNFFALHTFQSEFAKIDDLILECHIGDSEQLASLDDEAIYSSALEVLDAYFPEERLAQRLDRQRSRLLRHDAVFSLFAPGDRARTPHVSDVAHQKLLLAGDWVLPDDPDHRSFFMERAAVTGIEAANAVLRAAGMPDFQRAITTARRPIGPRLLGWPLAALARAIRSMRRALDVAYDDE